MTENLFFTSSSMSTERLSWLVEVMKYYSTRIYPGSLHHHPKTPDPSFTFFISGDACYTLLDRQYLRFWEVLFRLPPFRCLFDPRELRIRGISVEPFRMRSPDQIDPPAADGMNCSEDSIWDKLIKRLKNSTQTSSFGFLNLESPYMYRSSGTMMDLMRCAVKNNVSPEYYGYLDGTYAVHSNQQPLECDNISNALREISSSAIKKRLAPLFLACSRSAGARGLNTYVGENGKIVSICTIPPVKIKDLSAIAERFRKPHPIMSHASFFISFIQQRRIPDMRPTERKDSPPLILFVSHSPYCTEMANGALSLALSCANAGIVTRVVFIEDGVLAMAGHHAPDESDVAFNLQSLLETTSYQENLEYYVYTPSLQKRGLAGSDILKCVIPIGHSVLAQMLFQPPVNIEAKHQRAILF